MAYIIWLIILGLILFTAYKPDFPWWVALVVYLLAVLPRAWEKIGNHNDELKKSKRDEGLKLLEVREDMANRGLTFSGIRQQAENKVQEDFEFERRAKKRKFMTALIDSLFIK